MANLWNNILYGMIVSMVYVHCSPLKRFATDQQATDCYGTDCYYSPDYFNTDTIVNVNFPENLTEVVMTFIPEMMERHEQQIQNMTTIMERYEQQIHNMTSSMDNMAQLLKSQLILLSERLPQPTTPKGCQDVAAAGSSYRSGVYAITPQDGLGSFQVYCDMDTDGRPWTTFQKRFNGSVDFYRDWYNYERGFGSAYGEHWVGLSQIHRMTRSGHWQLRVDMEAFDGDKAYAMYDSFSIGDASSNYQLHIGEYSGTAGDSLRAHNNMAFSTKDRDNDVGGSHCAQSYKGAWWYSACHSSNLNGLYLGPTGNSNTGNRWASWKSSKALKMTGMKMRRVN